MADLETSIAFYTVVGGVVGLIASVFRTFLRASSKTEITIRSPRGRKITISASTIKEEDIKKIISALTASDDEEHSGISGNTDVRK